MSLGRPEENNDRYHGSVHYYGPKIESKWDWFKHQLLTFNFANVALLIVIIIVSININSTLQQQRTANQEAQASLLELNKKLESSVGLISEITDGKNFFVKSGFSNFSQLVTQYEGFNTTIEQLARTHRTRRLEWITVYSSET
jgi:hypothetical protein